MSFVNEDIFYNFLYGESASYGMCVYEEVEELMPEKPGLYTWRIRIIKENEEKMISFLDALYNARYLKAEVTGNLRLKYSGRLFKKNDISKENDVDMDETMKNKILRDVLPISDIPLYIGISQNLKQRLGMHKSQLFKYLNNAGEGLIIHSENNSDSESDSDTESDCFGKRLAEFWKEHNFYDTSCLYIKYKCYDKNELGINIRKNLREAEYYLNSVINPIFGRR